MGRPKGFGKCLRLLNSGDFQAVFANAPLRASHKYLLILARPNGLPQARLGLIIAQKNIRLAVQRNRIKRIARESFRQQQHKLAGIDAIVLARRELDQFDNGQLHKLMAQQWQRIEQKAAKKAHNEQERSDQTVTQSGQPKPSLKK
ncbi:MAG: ribonuclease P protein component [Exilibacterium sp.]